MLDAYLKAEGSLTLTALSEAADISKGRLSQLRKASDCPPDVALRIEKATSGAVSATEISATIRAAREPQDCAA